MLASNEWPDFLAASGSSPPILTTSTLNAALDYATHRGWFTVPVEPRLKRPWHRLKKGYKERPAATEAEIRSWFAAEPNLNIGIQTGGDLLVLDVDEKPGKMSGSEALASLEELHGMLPPTLTNLTGGGGRQLFFRLPPGYGPFGDRLPVVAEWLRSHPEADSGGVIDTRNSGLVVLPPSIHPNGTPYRWEDPDAEIAELPLAWCQTPEPLTLTDPERPARKSKSAPRLFAVGDPNTLDRMAHERMANVDPDALLGRDTLLLLANGDPDDEDRSHAMWRAILGAASVRFDPDALYIRMLNSPLEDGLRDHGRAWFDRNLFYAHRYLVAQVMTIEEIRAEIDCYEWTRSEFGKGGPGNRASAESMRQVLHVILDSAVRQASTEPICVKTEIAEVTGLSKMTVWRAFLGLLTLGWIEVVPEPDRNNDDPYIYRLLPPESRKNPRLDTTDPCVPTHEDLGELPLLAGSFTIDRSIGSTPTNTTHVSGSTTVVVSREISEAEPGTSSESTVEQYSKPGFVPPTPIVEG
ncbi:MAG: bifunctional DNA primase/polymerase [Acidimicrobiales bacterium]